MTSGGAKHTEYSEKSKQEDGLIAKNFKFWSNIEWIKKYLCAVHKKSPRAIMYSMEQWTHPRRLRNFRTCESALIKLDMESLAERREELCMHNKSNMKHFSQANYEIHPMQTGFEELYEVQHANTGRLQNSLIIYMQRLLNGSWKHWCIPLMILQ